MEPIITPPTSSKASSQRSLYIAGGVVLALVLLLVGEQMLRTDIVGTTGSSIRLSTDKLLYHTASGTTVPVTVAVTGTSQDTPLVGLKLTLDGLPAYVSIEENAITGSGSIASGSVRANVQRYGTKAIILISGITVREEGPFLIIPLKVTAEPTNDVTAVVTIWSDPAPGSMLISQVAVTQGNDYLSYPVQDGPFFRLSSVQVSPSASPSSIPTVSPTGTPTPTGTGSIVSPTPTGTGAVITPTPSPSPSPTTAPIQCSLPLRGDVNCDGRISIADLVLLADFLAGKAALSDSQISNGNVAETALGRTNLADVAAFAEFVSGRSPTL